MDRFIAYIGEMIPEWSFTAQGQYTMLALGKALQAVAGTSTFTVGLPCTPNSPAALNVLVGEGEIYMMESLEASVMGTLPADTSHQVLKQGMLRNTTTLSCPAPSTAGQSINYLIQATYQDSDVSLDPTTGNTNVVMPFFSGSVGQTPYSGPNNSGQTSNTFRQGVCNVTVKAGAAATTGTQATPAPDSGYVGLYVVTVANGQASVGSGNITPYSGAPAALLNLSQVPGAVQNKTWVYAADTGAANAYAVTLTPAPASYQAGQEIVVKIGAGNGNTGPATINVNGLGAKSIARGDGTALIGGELPGGAMVAMRYDGAKFQIAAANQRTRLIANTNFYVNASTGSDNNDGRSSGTAWATLQGAWNILQSSYDLNGYNATINVANGSYAGMTAGGPIVGATGNAVTFLGNTGTPSSCQVAATNASSFVASAGAQFVVNGFRVSATGTGNSQGIGLLAAGGPSIINFQNVDFASCAVAHASASGAAGIAAVGAYSISNGAPYHLQVSQRSMITIQGASVTLNGTPSFSAAFASAGDLGIIIASGATFTGAATGVRYSASLNSVIDTSGAGASFLPGSSAGSTATGAQYA